MNSQSNIYPLEVTGKVTIRNRSFVHISMEWDFALLYRNLLIARLQNGFVGNSDYEKFIGLTAFQPHITVLRRDKDNFDWSPLFKYEGHKATVLYSPYVYVGGWRSPFWNFYLNCECQFANKMRAEVGLRPLKHQHLTIANTKNFGKVFIKNLDND